MKIHVIASRTFAPLSLVDDAVRRLDPNDTLIAYGSTQVCRRAVLAATSRGLDARNATMLRDRAEFVEALRTGDAVWCFVARAPGSQEPTEGMGQFLGYFAAHRASPRRIDSPLPGKISTLISRFTECADEAFDCKNEHRKRFLISRALALSCELTSERDRYSQKIDAGMWLYPNDESATSRWIAWEFAYRCLCDALTGAEALINHGA